MDTLKYLDFLIHFDHSCKSKWRDSTNNSQSKKKKNSKPTGLLERYTLLDCVFVFAGTNVLTFIFEFHLFSGFIMSNYSGESSMDPNYNVDEA